MRARVSPNSGESDPTASAAALLEVVDSPNPPLRVVFGDGPLALATAKYEQRLATWRAWEPVSLRAQGGPTT